MKEKYFKWLRPSEEDRRGTKLEQGKIYNIENFPIDTVAEWVRTKAAKYVKDKSKEEEN